MTASSLHNTYHTKSEFTIATHCNMTASSFDKIYDIPYDFGFNANSRPDKESFDIYNLKSQASNSFINYRDIKVERHEVQKRLKFLKKDVLIQNSYFS